MEKNRIQVRFDRSTLLTQKYCELIFQIKTITVNCICFGIFLLVISIARE